MNSSGRPSNGGMRGRAKDVGTRATHGEGALAHADALRPEPIARRGLTIVIPTHGGRSSVRSAVEVLLALDDSDDIELLVVSDGEAQITRELLAGVQDARLTILEQEKLGAAAARNRGLERAKFSWVAFVDDDDVPRPNWLQVWRRGAGKDAVAITAAVAHARPGESDRGRRCRLDPNDRTMSASTLLAGAFWIKTDLMRAVDGYDQSLRAAENQDLGLRICDLLFQSDQSTLVHATDDIVIDLHSHDARARSHRYGSSFADAARLVLRRHAERLERDPQQKAPLLRIIARDDRLAGRHAAARRASWTAVLIQPLDLQNLRSFGLACIMSLIPGRAT